MEKKLTLVGGTPTVKPERMKETYFIGHWSPSGKLKYVKIGVTGVGGSRRRLRTLQTGNPELLTLMGVYRGDVERKLHRMFDKTRLHKKTEFFRPTKALLALIKNLAQVSKMLEVLDG